MRTMTQRDIITQSKVRAMIIPTDPHHPCQFVYWNSHGDTLRNLQSIVAGYITLATPEGWPDPPLDWSPALIVNEGPESMIPNPHLNGRASRLAFSPIMGPAVIMQKVWVQDGEGEENLVGLPEDWAPSIQWWNGVKEPVHVSDLRRLTTHPG